MNCRHFYCKKCGRPFNPLKGFRAPAHTMKKFVNNKAGGYYVHKRCTGSLKALHTEDIIHAFN